MVLPSFQSQRRCFVGGLVSLAAMGGFAKAAKGFVQDQEGLLEDGSYSLEMEPFVQIRAEAEAAAEIPDRLPDGWSKSPADPTKVLEPFTRLHLRDGMTWRAYLFHQGGNGNGVVWAMPSDADYPEVKDCPIVTTHVRRPPKPVDSLDDFMEIVQGDGSVESYMEASLLGREILEYGASWHGLSWRTHLLLGANPWSSPPNYGMEPFAWRNTNRKEWMWKTEQPAMWEPVVAVEGTRVQVTFHTYSGYQKERIYRFVDTFQKGSYRFTSSRTVLAEGRPGFVF